MKCLVILIFIGSAVWCMPNAVGDSSSDPIVSVIQQCAGQNMLLCLKEKALRYVEYVTPPARSQLIEGVTIINEGSARSSRSLQPLPVESTAREIEVESRLVDTITDFLENASVQISLPNSNLEEIKSSFEEETGRNTKGQKKKLKKLLPFINLLKMKFQALTTVFLGVLTFLAAKALVLLTIVIFAKWFESAKILLSPQTHETYEIIQPRPELHSHHDPHGYGGSAWGRLSEESQDSAFSAYSNKEV